jgi:sugar lactone lactonase YvrE
MKKIVKNKNDYTLPKLIMIIFIFQISILVPNASYAQTGIISTVAGNGSSASNYTCCYSGDGGQATVAELNWPHTIIFDAGGNMYISDSWNNVVRKVNTLGVITTIAGNGYGAGTYGGGFSGDGGQATSAELNFPTGIALDAEGNLYIADEVNYCVRKVNTSGIITTVAGNGTLGFNGDGGQATAAELGGPAGIAIDAMGNIYIADNNNGRIRKVTTNGIIATIAGNGNGGYTGDGGQATNAELDEPYYILLDAIGNLYISDTWNNVVRKVNTLGVITTIAGNGYKAGTLSGGYSGDGGQATAAELSHPEGLVVDAIGNIYISDYSNQRIRMVNTSGIITTIAGSGAAGYNGDGIPATTAYLQSPVGVAFDASGNLYIADSDNNRIRKVTIGGTADIEQQVTNKNEQIIIYPNPNNGFFVIEPYSTAKQTMQLYDVTGKLVLTQVINGKTNIDASNLAEGVYNISIISNESMVNRRLVIVK